MPGLLPLLQKRALGLCFIVRLIGKPLRAFPNALLPRCGQSFLSLARRRFSVLLSTDFTSNGQASVKAGSSFSAALGIGDVFVFCAIASVLCQINGHTLCYNPGSKRQV
jgi:hypothetical protein